jgi:twinkle protein
MEGTIVIKSWSDVGVNALRTNGKVKVVCPACHDRRKDKRDKCLSVDIGKNVAHCHYCGVSYVIDSRKDKEFSVKMKKEYFRPKWSNRTQLSEKAVKYFESRKISQGILVEMKITEGMEFMPQDGKQVNTIQFNYFLNGELINVKYRTGDKHFKLIPNAELIPYNLDAVKGLDKCIITEGEFDCLSFIACGFPHTVSVPNGASENTSYLDDYWDDYFEDKTTVYIAVDTDRKGVMLRNELLRRFGAERCKIVTYGEDCKDANEMFVKYGSNRVRESIHNATEIKIEGVFSVSDFEGDLDELYQNGLQRGLTIGYENFDALCSFETKRICVITGIPGHGKSEFLDEIIERMNLLHQWKTAYFSPENYPLKYHASKLASKITGKAYKKEKLPFNEYRQVKEHMNDNFFFIFPNDSFSVDSILEKGRYLIRRHGVKAFVIDPWNRLEHQMPPGMTETNYISQTLDKFTNFSQRYDVLLFLVAHPRKMVKDNNGLYDAPTLYDINGSANFYNKADYGISVHRNKLEDTVDVGVLKVKFRHLGETGKAHFRYNLNNGRYTPYIDGKLSDWDNSNHLIDMHKQRGDTASWVELPFEMGTEGEEMPF